MVLKILFTLEQVLGICFDDCMPKEGKAMIFPQTRILRNLNFQDNLGVITDP